MAKFWAVTLALLLTSQSMNAEEEYDWEFDFNIKRKSTISDFPFQEIDSDDLSDAAIGGALHTSTRGGDKPAYADQNEKDKKRKTSELEDSDAFALDKSAINNTQEERVYIPNVQVDLPQDTVSSTANGITGYNSDVVYNNNNHVFERP